jgi:GNAT superfamily N-acetyltransferase
MAQYAVESYANLVEEIKPLLRQHWEEIALFKDEIDLEPDYGFYQAAYAAGLMRFYTARIDKKLVGYLIFSVRNHHHYASHRWAVNDIVWIHPDHRNFGTGSGLFQFAEADLLDGGPIVIYVASKVEHPELAMLLQARGYANVELGFSKRFVGP